MQIFLHDFYLLLQQSDFQIQYLHCIQINQQISYPVVLAPEEKEVIALPDSYEIYKIVTSRDKMRDKMDSNVKVKLDIQNNTIEIVNA